MPIRFTRLTKVSQDLLARVHFSHRQCGEGSEVNGQVAEWLRSGLQSREHRFESGPRLQT